jgi:hypothetical protein
MAEHFTADRAEIAESSLCWLRSGTGGDYDLVMVVTVADSPVTVPDLAWYTSESADDENHDQETDMSRAGSPGGASWASVSPNGRPGRENTWLWVIYNRWTDVDDYDSELGRGEAGGEDEAKAAVAEWVRAASARHRVVRISDGTRTMSAGCLLTARHPVTGQPASDPAVLS